MLSDLNKPQKIFMIVLYCLTAVATILGIFAVYNIATIKKPWTLGVAYASTIEAGERQAPIIKVKVHGNENGNGQKVVDIQFNSYMDTEGNSIDGFGIQCIGEYGVFNKSGYDIDTIPFSIIEPDEYKNFLNKYGNLKVTEEKYSYIFGDFYTYYTADYGLTYQTKPYSDVPDCLLISINNENYRLTLKEYKYTYTDRNWFEDLFGFGGKEVEVKTTFTWYEVFEYIANSAIENSAKVEYEEFSLPALDLAKYLTIEYMDSKGQYHEMPDTAENRTYLTIPVEYSLDGATEAKDSLFKQIENTPTWDYYGNSDVKDYWNAYTELTITEDNINFVYNSDLQAYYITLDAKFSEYLQTLTNSEISVILDTTKLDVEVYGIDLQHFNFDIENFEIKVDSIEHFKLYNQELCSVEPTLSEV